MENETNEEGWKVVEPGVWKPENEGDSITGVLVRKEVKDEAAQLGARYFLENKDGLFLVWGSAVLDDRMSYVDVGSKVRVTFKGKKPNKRGQDVNIYKVEVSTTPSLVEVKPEDEEPAVEDVI